MYVIRDRRTAAARRGEAGFGLVEMIIAALLLTSIIASATFMLVSSGKALRKTDVHRIRAEVARAAVQHLSESQGWGNAPACRASALPGGSACDVSHLLAGQPWLTQGATGSKAPFTVQATALGVDSPVDSVGPQDRDGRVPDWFELRVVVNGGGATQPLVLDASTDSATRGTGGMVLVRTCAAPEQADERVEPGTCSAPGTVAMPPPSGSGPSLDRDMTSFAVSPSWAKSVSVTPIATTCSLTGPGGTTSLATTGSGSWISPTGLKPGAYRIECATPDGYEPWARRSTPSQGVLNVEEGRTATAFVMFRRPPVEVRINQGTIHYYRFQVCNATQCIGPHTRSTFTARFEEYDLSPLKVPIQPVPSPYGRLDLPSAATASDGATLRLRPGLYGNTVIAGQSQYYLYVGERRNSDLGVEFGAPISWFYVHPDGRVTSGPEDAADSGLWMVRWYCRTGDNPRQMACPEGRVPQGRGPLQLGGAGGSGAA